MYAVLLLIIDPYNDHNLPCFLLLLSPFSEDSESLSELFFLNLQLLFSFLSILIFMVQENLSLFSHKLSVCSEYFVTGPALPSVDNVSQPVGKREKTIKKLFSLAAVM